MRADLAFAVLVGASAVCVGDATATVLEEHQTDSGTTDTEFSSYEPSYFGVVAAHSLQGYEGDVKFKLSLKYEIIPSYRFFFGYTQKSYWSLFNEPSAPFRESNYAPELFYVLRLPGTNGPGDCRNGSVRSGGWLPPVQMGIRHESTGEAGPGSHGWNTWYAEPDWVIGLGRGSGASNQCHNHYLDVKIRVLDLLLSRPGSTMAPDNPDILHFYGHFMANVSWVIGKAAKYSLMYRHGTDGGRSAYEHQLDIATRAIPVINWIPFLGGRSNVKLFAQYWTGYGETLKNYNRNTHGLVFGLSAVR
jgi:phospholipase A1